MGAVIEPIGGGEAGCVGEPVGVGALDVLPQAVGCALVVSGPPEPEAFDPASLEFDPGSPALAFDPVPAAVCWAWPAPPADEPLAEGGGTVRSLWQ
jgi:hypothetical protein